MEQTSMEWRMYFAMAWTQGKDFFPTYVNLHQHRILQNWCNYSWWQGCQFKWNEARKWEGWFFHHANTYVDIGFCKIDIAHRGEVGANFSGATWTHKGDYFHQMFVMSNNIKNWAWSHYNFIVGTFVPLPSFPCVSFSCIFHLALFHLFKYLSPTFIPIILSSNELHHCCKCFQVMFYECIWNMFYGILFSIKNLQ